MTMSKSKRINCKNLPQVVVYDGLWMLMAHSWHWVTMITSFRESMAHLIQSPDWILVSWECCPKWRWGQQTSTDSNAQKHQKTTSNWHSGELYVLFVSSMLWKTRKQSHSSTSSHKVWLFQNSFASDQQFHRPFFWSNISSYFIYRIYSHSCHSWSKSSSGPNHHPHHHKSSKLQQNSIRINFQWSKVEPC